MPEVADRLAMFGTTVNVAALLAVPPTVAMTDPVPAVAPAGTGAVIDVSLQLVGAAEAPLNVTVLLPWDPPEARSCYRDGRARNTGFKRTDL